jgi:hypothetical protein
MAEISYMAKFLPNRRKALRAFAAYAIVGLVLLQAAVLIQAFGSAAHAGDGPSFTTAERICRPVGHGDGQRPDRPSDCSFCGSCLSGYDAETGAAVHGSVCGPPSGNASAWKLARRSSPLFEEGTGVPSSRGPPPSL